MQYPKNITTADRNSFAYHTITIRLPAILDGIIQNNNFSMEINNKLFALKNSIPTGRLELLQEKSSVDQEINKEIIVQHYTWDDCPFIFAENYFYQKLVQITEFRQNSIDFFSYKKELDIRDKKEYILNLLSSYQNIFSMPVQTAGSLLLKQNLGGNLADLSQLKQMTGNSLHVIIDHTKQFLEKLQYLKRVDIVLDNSGEELLNDVFLARWLLEKVGINQVYLHFKNIPYFVSDAMIRDFDFLRTISANISAIQVFWDQTMTFINENRLILKAHDCWSDFIQYRNFEKHILDDLNQSDLILFKGDLNYRKLVGDYYWDHSEKTKNIVNYFKTDILIIRVLKSEVVTGIDAQQSQRFDENWLINGKYGVIEYCPHGIPED